VVFNQINKISSLKDSSKPKAKKATSRVEFSINQLNIKTTRTRDKISSSSARARIRINTTLTKEFNSPTSIRAKNNLGLRVRISINSSNTSSQINKTTTILGSNIHPDECPMPRITQINPRDLLLRLTNLIQFLARTSSSNLKICNKIQPKTTLLGALSVQGFSLHIHKHILLDGNKIPKLRFLSLSNKINSSPKFLKNLGNRTTKGVHLAQVYQAKVVNISMATMQITRRTINHTVCLGSNLTNR